MLWLLAWLGPGLPAASQHPGPTPTYTNEDLERVAPLRGETGVLSTPAARDAAPARSEPKPRGEAYWRREAERLRGRLRPLRRRADELRLRLQEARDADWRRRPGQDHGSRRSPAAGLARRLELLEAEISEREDELQQRARREGALPGWLR